MKLGEKSKWINWARTHNLNWLIGFHEYVRGLLKDELTKLKAIKTKDVETCLHIDALYDYDRMLHINTFLLMYSYLEEWLYHCKKIYAPNINFGNGDGSLSRFKNVVKQLGINLSSKLWDDLRNAEKIRNCILHANGRISLYKYPQKVKTLIEKKNSSLKIDKDRVVISSDYLHQFNKNIWKLFDIMIEYGNKHQL